MFLLPLLTKSAKLILVALYVFKTIVKTFYIKYLCRYLTDILMFAKRRSCYNLLNKR